MYYAWECDCCGCILVISSTDTAADLECPQCKFVGCEYGLFQIIETDSLLQKLITNKEAE